MKTISIDQYVEEYGICLRLDDDASVFSLQVAIAVMKELTEQGDVQLLATETDLPELYRRVEVAKKAARKTASSKALKTSGVHTPFSVRERFVVAQIPFD